MTDAPNLKPCPSCRSAAKASVERIKDYARVSARCTECPMEAWRITVYDDVVESMGFVVKAWNTRADLIDMDVLRRVEAALSFYAAWELEQIEEPSTEERERFFILDCPMPKAMTDRGEKARETLADLRAMMEKLK